MMRSMLCLFLTSLVSMHSQAEIAKSSENGFIVRHDVTVEQSASEIFRQMTDELGAWWNPDHSFSGDASTMRVDAACFCERWGSNLVHHLDTAIWIEGKKVVMQGGLGPLKELGLSGTMIWSLAPGESEGTTISWKYHVFGYSETDLTSLAIAVDGVLKEQIDRLAAHLGNNGGSTTPK